MDRSNLLKELVFLELCAFYDGEFSHFALSNLNQSHIGIKNIQKSLRSLELDNRIKNCTINGYYNRYKIKEYIDCPSYIFDERLSIPSKLFILDYVSTIDDITIHRTARELALLMRNSTNYVYESNSLTRIKHSVGKSLFDYISNIQPIHLEPFSNRYPVIKTTNGYQIDSEPNAAINRSLSNEEKKQLMRQRRISRINKMINENGIGNFLFKKLQNRINKDKNNDHIYNYDLDEQYLNELFNQQRGCDFYTGKPFIDLTKVSIDRINSSLPYSKSNIVLTTNEINRLKDCLSLHDFIELCNTISRNFPMI